MNSFGQGRWLFRGLTVVGILIVGWLCFGLWFFIASNYSDDVAAGSYDLSQNKEASTLILKSDHTFQQVLSRSGSVQHTKGTWRHVGGYGGIAFSKEFMLVTGQELGANGVAYGELTKKFGIFPPSLTLKTYDIEWYGKVTSVPGDTILGDYAGDEEGVPATLSLRPDHTFEQTVNHGEVEKHTQGSWNLGQTGEISFSRSFIKTTGESLRDDETANTVGGTGSSLQIMIEVSPELSVPTFRKRLFDGWL